MARKSRSGTDTSSEATFRRRAIIAAVGGGAAWSLLVGRLAQLQMGEGEKYKDLAKENRVRQDLATPIRGDILDRFGQPLAAHRQAGRISIIREQAEDLEGVLQAIARIVDLPPERQARIIRDARRQAAFLPTEVIRELTYEEFARMSVHAVKLPGVSVEMGLTRSYPRGRDFAHVLGYVARASERDLVRLTDGKTVEEATRLRRLYKHPDMRTGRSGIEFSCDDWLTGRAGQRRVVTNASGRIIEELPSEDLAPVPGRDVMITIDASLQRKAIERFGAETGAAVVMDVRSGHILALVSTPAFDPNDFVNGISQSDFDVLRNDPDSPLYHKAFDGLYPPGSTFKMVVATAALEAGAMDPSERVFCNGRYRFGDRTWHCWKREGHGSVDMHAGVKVSCDVYFYELARRTGVEKIAEVSRRFGFGMTWPHLGLTGGARGVVPDDTWKRAALNEPWYEGETLNYGIGQGYLNTTPLQLAIMTARIATKGREIVPNLVGFGPDLPMGPRHDGPLPQDALERMKAAMYGVTSEGGGTALRSGDLGLGGVRMAGKTGTAQVRRITAAERLTGVISNEALERRLRDHALFVGYAPHDDPRYAVSVVVEHGGSGSRAAGPVARDIMAEALRMDSGRTPAWRQTADLDRGVGAPGPGGPSGGGVGGPASGAGDL